MQHRETEPIFHNDSKWRIIYENVDSLCCLSETNNSTTLNERIKQKSFGGLGS